MISLRSAALMLLLSLLALGCGPIRSSSSSDDDDDDGGDWTLDIVNETGLTIELVLHRPCPSEDPDDWNEVPLPAGGIAPGDNHRAGLPTPSCYALIGEAQNGSCFFEGNTGPLQQGEQATWTIGEEDLTCAG